MIQDTLKSLLKFINISYLLLFVVFLLSCQQEIEIPIPDQQPVYVVNCLFEPFTLPHVKETGASVSRTIGFLDSVDFQPIDDAAVSLWMGDSLVGEMTYSGSSQKYVLPGIHNIPNGMYRLRIEDKGNIIEAVDTLPQKVPLDKIIIDPFVGYNSINRPYARVNLVFNDPPEKNFYEIAISHDAKGDYYYELSSAFPAITSEPYYPTVMAPEFDFPDFLPLNDRSFNGQRVSIPVEYLHPMAPLNGVVEPHTITIHFRTISENYYRYKTSLIRQGYTTDEDIIHGHYEPMNVYSNIPNGYGIFAGYQSVDITFVIANNKQIEHDF